MRFVVGCFVGLVFCSSAAAQQITINPNAIRAPAPHNIEALTQTVMAQSAQSAEDDLRSMLAAMDAANQRNQARREQAGAIRQRQADARRQSREEYARRSQTGQENQQTARPVNPCVAQTVAEWRTCIDRIDANLARSDFSPTDKERFQVQLQALRAELAGAEGDSSAAITSGVRSRAIASGLLSGVDRP